MLTQLATLAMFSSLCERTTWCGCPVSLSNSSEAESNSSSRTQKRGFIMPCSPSHLFPHSRLLTSLPRPYLLPYLTLPPPFPCSLVLTALGAHAAGFAAARRCLRFLFGFNVALCITVTISDRVTMSHHKYRRVVLGLQGIFTVSDLGVCILCPVYCGC